MSKVVVAPAMWVIAGATGVTATCYLLPVWLANRCSAVLVMFR